ncbi:pilus assembly PilX family protein [Halopseudomonas xiamenensis]|uniref:pilus assembly PilX family protein n=1 Tax=Halopseudomonas xiamenensis TaxID=157792 RepID=UPI001624743B|nr:PilX N-terminal domain-containing pilus assembly protein [Halopseudomonas xiamenensis]
MYESTFTGRPQTQRGAALLVSLIILLMVSLMGLSALRSSLFSGKVATGVQGDAMTFEAAETALGVTYRKLNEMTDQQLYTAFASGVVEYCVERSNSESEGACGSNARLDERGLLRAGSLSYLGGYTPLDGSQVSQTGAGTIFADYQINMLAESEMPALSLQNHHFQEALKRGIAPSSELN